MAETSLINNNEGTISKPVTTLRDGFASCLRCGNTGVKDTFYGKGKQYCSQNCVKGTTSINQQNNLVYHKINNLNSFNNTASVKLNIQKSLQSSSSNQVVLNVQKKTLVQKVNLFQNKPPDLESTSTQQKDSKQNNLINNQVNNVNNNTQLNSSKEMKITPKNSKQNLKLNINSEINKLKTVSFDWCTLLNKDKNFKSVSVSSFRHISISNIWNSLVFKNLKVEVRNTDVTLPFLPSSSIETNSSNETYWIAFGIKVEGYFLLLRNEGYEEDSSADFWVHIYNSNIHPVGWAASQKKILIPPNEIVHKQSDWKSYLAKRLIGSKTLPHNFYDQMKDCLKSKFRVGMKLEVIDKTRISCIRVATINTIIGGRLHVVYEGLDKDAGFWCHQQSPVIHPVGWAQLVGHELRATCEYAKSSLEKAVNQKWNEDDADFSYFPHLGELMNQKPNDNCKFKKGMKLETIDPLNLSTICVATITKVLRNNYLMIGIDGMMALDGSDSFCYHASSGNIFPVGFSRLNKINLTPPKDYKKPFSWYSYLKETKSEAAPVALFNNEIPNHGFEKGMYLEAVDLMEPRLICVAMVKEVIGRLLKIHFNGWDDSFDQWVDCDSVELFPIGWCEIVGYPLEPPKDDSDSSTLNLNASSSFFVFDNAIKKRGKTTFKGRSKKRKRNTLSISDKKNGVLGDEENSLTNNYSNEDTDNCTLFNSVTESNGSYNEELVQKNDLNDKKNEMNNELTCNSSVRIKPSPIILNNVQKMQNMNISSQHPSQWTTNDVVNYLRSNDCGNYCNVFIDREITGQKLIGLNREEVWKLMDNKLGPSLKVYALVEELKKKY